MNQRIFEMGLSVEATSLYLLIVPLSEGQAGVSPTTAASFWNGEPDDLNRAASELKQRGVLAEENGLWVAQPSGQWKGLPAF